MPNLEPSVAPALCGARLRGRPLRWAGGLVLSMALPLALAAQGVGSMSTVRGELAFDGKATLGDFTGITTTLTGRLIGADDVEAVRGWVEAPSASLHTGNGRRDRDMRASLEAERFPALRFDLDAVALGPRDGDSSRVTLRGRFTIHGVTREEAVPGWLWSTPTTTRFRGQLPLDLRDYRIGGLSKMLGVLRMNPEIVVRVDVSFSM
jgi:polyisoprenoid-binding protein YceI